MNVAVNKLNTEVDLVIKNHVLGAAAIGVVPLPLADLAGLALLQAAMVKKICELYKHPTSDRQAMALVVGLSGGVASVVFGPSVVRSLFKMVPGLGSLPGAAALSISAGTVTYALGRLLQQHFEDGGSDFGEVTDDLQSRFLEEMEKGREWVQDTINNAKENLSRNNQDDEAPEAKDQPPADDDADSGDVTPKEDDGPGNSADTGDDTGECAGEDVGNNAPADSGAEPAAAEPDDLRKIEGIGPKIAGLCQDAGIRTFQNLADSDIATLQKILDDAGSRYRLADPSTWPKQAHLAASGQWDELAQLQDQLKGGRQVP